MLTNILLKNIAGQQPDDFWYDVQMEIVETTLETFDEQQWKDLSIRLPLQRKEENWCLLECLGGCVCPQAVCCIEKIVFSENDVETMKFATLALESQNLGLLSQSTKNKLLGFREVMTRDMTNKTLRLKLNQIFDRLL